MQNVAIITRTYKNYGMYLLMRRQKDTYYACINRLNRIKFSKYDEVIKLDDWESVPDINLILKELKC